MPVETCLSNILSIRFEFGVPLEDVFPPDDIHPRLKYLFQKALEAYLNSGSNIEHILSYGVEMQNEGLLLENKLVFAADYRFNVLKFSTGTYFSVIRSFLESLPLPLLPSYTKGVYFEWGSLTDECRSLLQSGDYSQIHILDYNIARTLNKLPAENLMLLNLFVKLLRNTSMRKTRGRYIFSRKSLLALSNYFCSCLFLRPFGPEYAHKPEYRPLLLYLILHWRNIIRCCHSVNNPAYPVRDTSIVDNNLTSQGNFPWSAFLHNDFFNNGETISFEKNLCTNNLYNSYLKDTACQTETDLGNNTDAIFSKKTANKDILPNDSPEKQGSQRNTDCYKLAYIEELQEDHNASENNVTLYQTAHDFTIHDTSKGGNNSTEIIEGVIESSKKATEPYIYDDYDTFKKEEFNQIGKKGIGSFLSRISRYGQVYTSSKNSSKKEAAKSNRTKDDSPESDNSYFRYPDVFDSDVSEGSLEENGLDDKNRDVEEIKVTYNLTKEDLNQYKTPVAQKLFANDSYTSTQGEGSKYVLQDGTSKKKQMRKYISTRLRKSLAFLRTLTLKSSTLKMFENKVPYYRLKNRKYHTI